MMYINFINSLNGIEEYNKQCIEFLEKSINSNDNCIVITHHIPSSSLINIRLLICYLIINGFIVI